MARDTQYPDTIEFRPPSKLLLLYIGNLLIECIAVSFVLELIENTVVNNVLVYLKDVRVIAITMYPALIVPFFGQGSDLRLTHPSNSSSF